MAADMTQNECRQDDDGRLRREHLKTQPDRGLIGRGVVVTGGGSGIGFATAVRFVAEGARVVILDIDRGSLESVTAEAPGIAGAVYCDVSDPIEVARAFEEVDRILGPLNVLIANAGISIRHPFLDISPEEWRRVMSVNLDGIFYCSQAAARRMSANGGGVILMTASTNGLVGHPYYADYNASKAGVILLARSMALELAPQIRVNAVCPGYVMTPMQQAEYTDEMLRNTDAKIPLGRHARPDEVAALFAFLASTDGAYLTGAAIPLDGGELAGGLASRDWIRHGDE
jgi:NAD(P)-dependent dehydrogenase (short-subunit alcohol dehydrogenase family)